LLLESTSTQVGRRTEQLRSVEEEIVSLQNRVKDVEMEIAKLYEKHNVSKDKMDFVNECDAIANLLTNYMVKLRKNKIHLLHLGLELVEKFSLDLGGIPNWRLRS